MVARIDLVTDPRLRADLLLARRGTAYFSRKLAELTDADLSSPSLVDGCTRAHVVARVGYHARAMALAVEAVRTGEDIASEGLVDGETVAFGATLPAGALRNLHAHAAVHLSVEWRDLPPERWTVSVADPAGEVVPVAETPWRRAREVWLAALDLGNGGRLAELPAEVLARVGGVR